MFKRKGMLVLILSYIVIFSATSMKAQDVVNIAPKNYKVVVDNEKLRAIDFIGNPGEKTAMHSHPDYLIYVIEGGTTKSTTPDGKTETIVFKKGQTLWRNATTHSTENAGKTKIHLLLVELKK